VPVAAKVSVCLRYGDRQRLNSGGKIIETRMRIPGGYEQIVVRKLVNAIVVRLLFAGLWLFVKK
jgi:hypothetical protein